MQSEISAIEQVLSQNIVGHQFLGTLFAHLRKIEPAIAKILRINLERYRMVDGVKLFMEDTPDLAQQFSILNEIFPTFLFQTAAQLNSIPKLAPVARELYIGTIGNLCFNNIPRQTHVEFFLRSIKTDDTLEQLNARVFDRSNLHSTSYFPRVVNWDMFLIAKNYYPLATTNNRNLLIEHMFFAEGIFQILYRYYFDLMALARNDLVASHIHEIFYQFFKFMSVNEANYWRQYPGNNDIRRKIKRIVEADLPSNCHLSIRQKVFDQIMDYNPFVHEGTPRKMSAETRKYFKEQLLSFNVLPATRLSRVLRVLQECKGNQYVSYLFSQIVAFNPKKLEELKEYLLTTPLDEQWLPLTQLVVQIAKNLSAPPEIFLSEHTRKKREAIKKQKERQNQKMMTEGDASQHISQYLQKLYERVRKEGALTQENINEYLTRFRNASGNFLKDNVTEETREEFENSVNGMFQEIYKEGGMNARELREYQGGVHKELEGIEVATPQEREEKVENIGIVIVEAASYAERNTEAKNTEKLFNESLDLKLTFEEKGTSYETTVDKVLKLPVSHRHKIHLLTTFSPKPISPKMLKAIESVQFRIGISSPNPEPIFTPEGVLLKKKLLQLLFPDAILPTYLTDAVIPMDLDQKSYTPKASALDFFGFPLSDGPPRDENWYDQHLRYLEMLLDHNQFDIGLYQKITANIGKMKKMKYKKYYNIFTNAQFEETIFSVVVNMWQNNALSGLRIEEPKE
ncbi:MAG: hypothetical protein HQM11_03420 [SAR324 cluster bacterium]|nr:hypothetical protein [SAR324 cluster bacterium]